MGRPRKQPPPARVEDEELEKLEALRRQVLDVIDDDGFVLIFDLQRKHYEAVDPRTAFSLCRRGLASLEDPPGKLSPGHARPPEAMDWGATKKVHRVAGEGQPDDDELE